MTTALPVGRNYTGWSGISQYANLVTNNLFWPLMMGAVVIVIFFVLYKNTGGDVSQAFFGSSWAWFIMSIFLSIMGLVPGSYVLIGLGLLGFSGLGLALAKDRF